MTRRIEVLAWTPRDGDTANERDQILRRMLKLKAEAA
jgi:hypothetical protein